MFQCSKVLDPVAGKKKNSSQSVIADRVHVRQSRDNKNIQYKSIIGIAEELKH